MRSTLALGTLFVATTASVTITVTGLAGSAGVPGTERFVSSASAAELVPFEDCDELLAWYVAEALPHVGPYGLDGPPMVTAPTASLGGTPELMLQGEEATSGVGARTQDAVGSSGTGTNVQEVGVDEPDRAKTDGRVVVHVRGDTLVVTDVTGEEPREVGTLDLPRSLAEAELLLLGDTVLVLGPERPELWSGPRPGPTDVPIDFVPYPQPVDERSRLLEVSIADPTEPAVVSDQSFGGALLSARQYGDTARVVLSTRGPVIDFVSPNRERTREEATEENREILRASTIEDWLPTVRSDGGEAEPLVDCVDVRHPDKGAGYGTVTVLTVHPGEVTSPDTLAVTTDGQTVYSSTDRLYLATSDGGRSTEVHAFALDGGTTTYAASGEVRGRLADRWSMDEHDGVLRLALAHGPGWWAAAENGITTLREQGEELVELGSVKGLGPDEEIRSVRWFDDLAIVVTFRQTDPLYTVDLSDPASPTTLGALKIPGFSEYLHPIGGDRLLGLGQDATTDGRVLGGQASLFDIADLADPVRLDTVALGAHAYPAASQDPRTFTWLDDRQLGLAVIGDGWSGRAAIVELRVGEDGTLSEGDSWPLRRWQANEGRALPLPDGSIALVGAGVEVVTLD